MCRPATSCLNVYYSRVSGLSRLREVVVGRSSVFGGLESEEPLRSIQGTRRAR